MRQETPRQRKKRIETLALNVHAEDKQSNARMTSGEHAPPPRQVRTAGRTPNARTHQIHVRTWIPGMYAYYIKYREIFLSSPTLSRYRDTIIYTVVMRYGQYFPGLLTVVPSLQGVLVADGDRQIGHAEDEQYNHVVCLLLRGRGGASRLCRRERQSRQDEK